MGARVFCVDGTNLVRTAYGYGGPAHAAQESADTEHLIAVLAAACEAAGAEVELELYFDGAFRAAGAVPSNMTIRFGRDASADELILDRVRSMGWSGGGKATVVTADAELGRRAQEEGGRWLRVEHGTPPEGVARRIGGRSRG